MKKGLKLIYIGLFLILCSLLLTLFNLYSNYTANVEKNKILPKIDKIIDDNKSNNISDDFYPDYYYNPNISMPISIIDNKKYVGMLYIDSLNITLPVLDSWNYYNKLPARCYGSVYLNDMVICSHDFSDSFAKLRKLNINDEVIFVDIDGNVFNYSVTEITIVNEKNIDEMINNDFDLTLFTCDYNVRNRVTVRCNLIK